MRSYRLYQPAESDTQNGNLARSMRASMAIPGAFKAIDINGIELLDGGLVDNLPVDVVLDMGADIV